MANLQILLSQNSSTAELQWLERLWNHENMFETGELELMSVNHRTISGGIIRTFIIFLNMMVYRVFLLESSYRGISNKYT